MLLVNGLLVTTIISVLSALFGTLIGAIICFFRMKKNKWASRSASAFIDFMRCIPQLVFLMILFYVVFSESNLSGLWVSVIAFSLIFGAYVSEMFRVAIEGIDKGQWEAGLAMGFSRVKTFRILILPLAVQRIIPVYKGELIGLIKSTSIVGYIAVQDMTKASDLIRGVTFDPFFPLIIITIIYFALIWILTRSISYADWRTKPRRRIL
jgi:polar amino acid transport system substrate-binding protein